MNQDSAENTGPGLHTRPPAGLTPEEKMVFEECRRESFYLRGLPFGVTGGVLTSYLIKQGTLLPHPRFGALPKIAGAMVIGYMIGKISYINKCKLKILQLENSPMADFYRKQFSGNRGKQTSRVLYTNQQQGEEASVSMKDEQETPDIDTERKQIKGLDESFQPNIDTSGERTKQQGPLGQKGQQNQQSFTSYEELRQANRSAAMTKKVGDAAVGATNSKPKLTPVIPMERKTEKGVRRNKYGDVIEE